MAAVTNTDEAWLDLYDDTNFQDSKVRVPFGTDIPNLDDFNDWGGKTSSIKWLIPAGWTVDLFDDKNYKDTRITLVGNGYEMSIANLDDYSFGGKPSSLRWIQIGPIH